MSKFTDWKMSEHTTSPLSSRETKPDVLSFTSFVWHNFLYTTSRAPVRLNEERLAGEACCERLFFNAGVVGSPSANFVVSFENDIYCNSSLRIFILAKCISL